MKEAIIKLWVNSILNKNKTLEEAPEGLKEVIKEILIAEGKQDFLLSENQAIQFGKEYKYGGKNI